MFFLLDNERGQVMSIITSDAGDQNLVDSNGHLTPFQMNQFGTEGGNRGA